MIHSTTYLNVACFHLNILKGCGCRALSVTRKTWPVPDDQSLDEISGLQATPGQYFGQCLDRVTHTRESHPNHAAPVQAFPAFAQTKYCERNAPQ